MKKFLAPLLALCLVLIVGSCSGTKDIAYFQNIDTTDLSQSRGLYDAKILPKDELTITVITSNPEASRPFNLAVSSTIGTGGQLASSNGSLQRYLVDNNGNINFPVLGTLHVEGLTKTECENMIQQKVRPYLAATENPVVTVRMSGFRVTVMGEVGSPKVVPVTSEKMSVLEAIASAGDLSIYGKRKNVLLIREDDKGQKTAHRLDLTDANLFNSPYYYLQQNDIIYVQPNATKANNASIGQSTTIWFSVISILTSLASLTINIIRN